LESLLIAWLIGWCINDFGIVETFVPASVFRTQSAHTQAFVLAYRWDLRNEEAREQMIEICAETSSRYMDLQMECNHLKAEVARLKATSVTWCLEEGVNFYPDKFPASRSYGVRSPHFYFSHFEGWMEFFPRGVAQAQASKARFGLVPSNSSDIWALQVP
jgi:hypothetical protein